LVWAGLGVAFFYRPDLIKWALRSSTRGAEFVGDTIPSPWGAWLEIFLREVGGFWWFQIAILVVILRVAFSTIGFVWRKCLSQMR
jgi:hypothetical protein